MVNWMNSLEYLRLEKGQDNQGQNQSLVYLCDIELYDGFAYQLWLYHRWRLRTSNSNVSPSFFFFIHDVEIFENLEFNVTELS